jgi:hypothetical protein
VGQALATEAIAESIRSGGVWEAESNIKLFDFVSTLAATDWDASFTVERINCQENTAKASRRKCEFDQMWEVPFVRKADDLALATSHLAQSSSASRVTAAQAGRVRIRNIMPIVKDYSRASQSFLFARLTRTEHGFIPPDAGVRRG